MIKTLERIFKLAWVNFLNQYRYSYIGILWVLIYPLTSVFILWFIFTQAFKVQPNHGNVPFILWLLAGMAIWNFFAEALSRSALAITANAFMIKKRAFNLAFLPIIQVCTSLFSHLLFLLLVLILYCSYKIYPGLHFLQLPYYLGCGILLTLSLAYTTSSVTVFIPDLNDFISVFIQLFFWVTPIFWSISMLPERFRFIVWLNPIAYLAQGYRDSLLGQGWIWDHTLETLVFWFWTLFFLLLGQFVFRRLKPHFADVL